MSYKKRLTVPWMTCKMPNHNYGESDVVQELSDKLAYLSPYKYCQLFSSGTTALWSAFQILKQHHNVKTSSFCDYNYPAILNACHYANYEYVICPADINGKSVFTKDTDVECTTTFDGQPQSLSSKYTIEDNAYWIWSDQKYTFSMISFGTNKTLESGCGGALFFDDAIYIDSLKKLKYQGAVERSDKIGRYKSVGFNVKYNDYSADLILKQLDRLQEKQKAITEKKIYLKDLLKNFGKIETNTGCYTSMICNDKKHTIDFLQKQNITYKESWQPLSTLTGATTSQSTIDFCNKHLFLETV